MSVGPEDVRAIEALGRADAQIDAAWRLVNEASSGYVAIHADPDRGGETGAMFEHISRARAALVDASSEAQRLLTARVHDIQGDE